MSRSRRWRSGGCLDGIVRRGCGVLGPLGLAAAAWGGDAAPSYWYCTEIESAGLRYHYGRWTHQEFRVSSHSVKQSGVQLDLESFGMLPGTTSCAYDASVHIISCSDHYTLFNLNIRTGRAAMSYVRGWVDQQSVDEPIVNDLSVTAVSCRRLDPRPLSPSIPGYGAGPGGREAAPPSSEPDAAAGSELGPGGP